MQHLRTFVIPAIAALVYLAWLLFSPREESAAPARDEVPGSETREARRDQPPTDAQATSPSASAPKAAAAADRLAQRARRDDMLQRIEAALAQNAPSPPAAAPDGEPPSAPAHGSLDKVYIQERIREDLIPIAQECYQSSLEDNPELSGKLIVNFSIVGDESVGGVVEESEIDEASTLKDEALAECMRESTMAITFKPPEGGGRVSVKYPFIFQLEDPQ